MSDPHDPPQQEQQEHDVPEAATRAVGPSATKVGIQVMVLSGSAKGTSKTLGEMLRIGKAPDNDLVLDDDTVSRHHCELTRANDGVHVRDLGSTNGTFLESARIAEAIAPVGSVVRVGDAVSLALRPSLALLEVEPHAALRERTSPSSSI